MATTAARRGLEGTASNPMTGRVPEMKPTPRSPRLGAFADAILAVRDFINRAQIPQGVPLIGGEGLGSLILGRAPEELVEMSYGNMPVRVNPMAGRTASFVPEMKPGRGAQVADLLSLAGVPGGGRMAAAATGGLADFGTGAERAMLAYHGTPHRFDRFDASKIGTGEGAQAYGHGIYFAEAPGVAQQYKEALSSPAINVRGREVKTTPGTAMDTAKAWLEDVYERGFFNSKTANAFDEAMRNVKAAPVPNKQAVLDALERLKASEATMMPSGSLYTVDIPDEMIPKMLDWDKPLSQQAPEVRKALADTYLVNGPRKGEKVPLSQVIEQWKSAGMNPNSIPEMRLSGNQIYSDIVMQSGNQAVASDALRQAGIPGIRYLDAGSRGPGGTNTSNFVVFPGEEQRVQILKRE